jgi:F-type H+-transporting ATPase subunit b
MRMTRRLLILALFAVGTIAYAQERAAENNTKESTEEARKEAEEAEKDEARMPWKLANFALLVIGLGVLLGKTVPKHFAERTAAIQKDIKEAQALKADAERRAAEVETKVAKLGNDIDAFRVEAAKQMAAEGERIRQETAAHIKRVEEQSSLEIESAGKLARRELKQYSAELAMKLAEERVRARMDANAESGLVDSFVAELGRQSAFSKERTN